MGVLTIKLEDCIPGMITEQPIVDIDTGVTIVGKGQVLTQEIISNLDKFRYDTIKISVNSWEKVWNVPTDTVKKYSEATQEIKELLHHISSRDEVDVNAFKNTMDLLEDEFKDNYKVLGCVNLVKHADKYVYTHSVNVALLCGLVGKWLNYGEEAQKELKLAGLLHDIGKMKIDMEILNKPGKLTDKEFEMIKNHPLYGYDMIKGSRDISLNIKTGVLMHHERADGSGYPYGLQDDNISDYAKIIAVCDVYDAMISDRPYKKKQTPFKVMEAMFNGEFGKLDQKVLYTFLSHVVNYYIGVYVLLNTGEIGEVVSINPMCIYKPYVRVKDKFINLYAEPEIEILEVT